MSFYQFLVWSAFHIETFHMIYLFYKFSDHISTEKWHREGTVLSFLCFFLDSPNYVPCLKFWKLFLIHCKLVLSSNSVFIFRILKMLHACIAGNYRFCLSCVFVCFVISCRLQLVLTFYPKPCTWRIEQFVCSYGMMNLNEMVFVFTQFEPFVLWILKDIILWLGSYVIYFIKDQFGIHFSSWQY